MAKRRAKTAMSAGMGKRKRLQVQRGAMRTEAPRTMRVMERALIRLDESGERGSIGSLLLGVLEVLGRRRGEVWFWGDVDGAILVVGDVVV